MRTLTKALFLLLLIVPFAAAFAQEQTTVEVRNGTVIATSPNELVVRMTDGTLELIAIPPDFQFTVDGKNVALADLKPGTQLTAEITTATKPTTVRMTQIRNGEVIKIAGGNLWVRTDGKIKTYNIPDDFRFILHGKPVPISDLRPGQRLTAEIIYKTENLDTSRDVKVSGVAPQPNKPQASATEEPKPETPMTEPVLPKTGSDLPLVALLGAGLIATGIAIRRG